MSALIRSSEIARRLSVTMHTIRDMHKNGLLPQPVEVGKRELWKNCDIDDWLKNKLSAREGCGMDAVNALSWPPVLLDAKQIADKLLVSITMIHLLVKNGKFPMPIIVSKHNSYRWVKSEIDDWVNQRLSEREGVSKIPCSPVFIGAKEFAEKLGVSGSDYIHELYRKGKLPPAIKVCRTRLWVASEINCWLEQRIADRDAGIVGGAE
jgi:predicted DNA-binding transcriptional regulator AlpA